VSNAPALDEQELIEKTRNGDKSAFGELVSRHHSGVVTVVYRMCGDAGLAEDAAQDAFLKAWLRIDTYRPVGAFRNWLYRIAVNSARDTLRRQRETVDIDDLSLQGNTPDPAATVARHEQADRVQAAVLALPPASREVIILREYQGLSYREIADVLDIPRGTVMSRLNYARNRLRDSLAEEIGAL
jgi:RNA polymerase sigma-70 factor, ECF subfamily